MTAGPVLPIDETPSEPPARLLSEDWWAVWLALGVVALGYVLFANGASLRWIAVTPAPWHTGSELLAQLRLNAPRYLAQAAAMLALFGVALVGMGHRARAAIPAVAFLYLLALLITVLAAWDRAQRYHLEPSLLALVIGLALSNLLRLPRRLDAGFRVEFYIKTGIVLFGATAPIQLLVRAGPIAILQASAVSIVTFVMIFRVARFLELDRRLAAMLAAGGAVCGVAAVMAMAGAVRARREDIPVAIAMVLLWALGLIVLMPLLARAWYLSAGAAGAWIGTAELADAAGLAAAQAYGSFVRSHEVAGTPEQTVLAYTLVKVLGRDAWVGIWAFVMSLVAAINWNDEGIAGGGLWWRFPKFILGFIGASLLITVATRGMQGADYELVAQPALIAPLVVLRDWAFVFSFLSIGLSTRLRDLASVSGNAFVAFSSGLIANLVVGFLLSAVVFEAYWSGLKP